VQIISTTHRSQLGLDNDIVGVFFNGEPIAENITHKGCPILDEFRIDVPQRLVKTGQNVVVFHVSDQGDESFFDARILAELSESEVNSAIENLEGNVELRTLQVPVSELTFECINREHRLADIKFIVDATGEQGEIAINRPSENDFNVELFLNGQLITKIFATPQLSRHIQTDELLDRPGQGIDQGLAAFGKVLSQETITEQINDCIAQPTQPSSLASSPHPERARSGGRPPREVSRIVSDDAEKAEPDNGECWENSALEWLP
jgi:hypothetical protein